MRLFHVSEEPGIERFVPRPSRSTHNTVNGDVVWAVAEAGLYNYLVPRNCPRVSFYASDSTQEADVVTFLDGDRTKRVLAVEADWLERCLETTLFRYEFDPAHFFLFIEPAQYYLSRQIEVPRDVQAIRRPLQALRALGVEVRLMPSLWELRERVLHSSLGFSFIRMNHAAPPAAGYAAYHPL